MADQCELTELDKASCAHCRCLVAPKDELAALRSQLLARGGWVLAQYPGYCASCGEWFNIGAAIHTSTPPGAGWLAECCAP